MPHLAACITCGTLTADPEHARHCPKRQHRNGSTRQWRHTRQHILNRDNHTCQVCGNHATEVDHIVSLMLGGTDHESNLRALCRPCNNHKGSSST